MKLLPTRFRKLLAIGAAGSLMFMAPMPASAEVATSTSGPCGAMAAAVVEESGVAPADVSYDFVCTEAIVTVEITSPDGTVSSLTEETADVAVRMDDLSITDFDYQFSAQIADPTLFTPRFHCDTNVERCYYPNGEEAGL